MKGFMKKHPIVITLICLFAVGAIGQSVGRILNIDNLQLDGNTISSTDTNGDINVSPDGTGSVVVDTDLDVDNLNLNGNTLSSTDTNGNVILDADGTGVVNIADLLDLDAGSQFAQISTPANPASNHNKFYAKGTNYFYNLNSDGEEIRIQQGVDKGGIANSEYNFIVASDGNSLFEIDVSGWTGSTTAPTHETTDEIEGAGSLSWDPAGAETLRSDAITIPAWAYGKNCYAEVWYTGGDTDYELYVLDGSNTEIESTANDSTFDFEALSGESKRVPISFVCPTSGSVKLSLESGSDEPEIIIDRAYIGQNFNVDDFRSTGVFSALVTDGSGTTTVSQENADWIDGNCTNATTGDYVCTFKSGIFNNAPNCSAAALNPADTSRIGQVWSVTDSALTVRITTGSNSSVDGDFYISCQKQGSDSREIYTTDQSDYDWTDYTPTFTGFGTVSNVNFQHSKVCGTLYIRGTFDPGTTTATEARISLPGTLESVSTLPTISSSGSYYIDATANNNGGPILIEASKAYFTFGYNGTYGSGSSPTGNPLAKADGDEIGSSGNTISIDGVGVSINGWKCSNRASQLVNSVVSPYKNILNICSFYVSNESGTPTITSSRNFGGCLDSVTDNGTGDQTNIFVSGTFSATPNCNCTVENDTGRSCIIDNATGISSASVRTNVYSLNNNASDDSYSVTCIGPK